MRLCHKITELDGLFGYCGRMGRRSTKWKHVTYKQCLRWKKPAKPKDTEGRG